MRGIPCDPMIHDMMWARWISRWILWCVLWWALKRVYGRTAGYWVRFHGRICLYLETDSGL